MGRPAGRIDIITDIPIPQSDPQPLRLNAETSARVNSAVRRPRYDPSEIGTGIVHIGPGAFHRAHQAAFIDDLLARDPRWGIAGVSLRSAATTDQLDEQDGLYTLAIRDAEPADRLIAAHRQWFGPARIAQSLELLDDPAIRLVTATVTEKGYCRAGDGELDRNHPDIAADRVDLTHPRSLPGWIVAGLARRRAARLAPPVIMSCDNLPHNGAVLRRVVTAFAADVDRDLAAWIADEVAFPDTMVDAITPASTPATLAAAAARIGLTDTLAVEREAFRQWVVADTRGATMPDLAGVGAIVTQDVAAWELTKLRLLNGAHSALAYLGLLRGHETVAAAMADDELASLLEKMMRGELATTVPAAEGLDPDAYIDTLLRRFANPAIAHRLSQIAMDGSQKLPYRLIAPLSDRFAQGRDAPLITQALAAWCAWCIREARAGRALNDPLHDTIAGAACEAEPVRALLALRTIFPAAVAGHPGFADALTREAAALLEA